MPRKTHKAKYISIPSLVSVPSAALNGETFPSVRKPIMSFKDYPENQNYNRFKAWLERKAMMEDGVKIKKRRKNILPSQ